MATHIISFRIAHDATATDRWESTVEKIRSEAKDRVTWEETTSFFLINSNKTASDLALSIYLGSKFSGITDKLLVIDVARNTYAVQGKIDYPATLASFFPVNAMHAIAG